MFDSGIVEGGYQIKWQRKQRLEMSEKQVLALKHWVVSDPHDYGETENHFLTLSVLTFIGQQKFHKNEVIFTEVVYG